MPAKTKVDAAIIHRIRRELNRRPCDTSKVQIRVSYGVIYLSGEMRSTRGMGRTLKEELDVIKYVFSRIPGVKEVSDYGLRLIE